MDLDLGLGESIASRTRSRSTPTLPQLSITLTPPTPSVSQKKRAQPPTTPQPKPKSIKKKRTVAPSTAVKPSINLRTGLSIAGKKALSTDALELVYSDNSAILDFATQDVDTGDLFSGKAPKPKKVEGVSAVTALNSELSPIQRLEINSVTKLSQLKRLLKKYEENQDLIGYMAALVQHKDLYSAKKDLIAIYERILARPTQRKGDTLPKLPARYNKNKQTQVKKNLSTLETALKTLDDEHDDLAIIKADFGDKAGLEKLAKALKKELDSEDWRKVAALSDYANTLYAQFRDAMESPWDILSGTVTGQTKDSAQERLAAIYSAQLALEGLPDSFVRKGPVYRWLEGVEEHRPGDLISSLALYSASTGTQSSDVFAGKGKRTLFVVRLPASGKSSGKFIQLLSGTKNWYQREVLFPTYAQFVVREKQIKVDDQEVWYTIEELDGGVQLITADTIIGIGSTNKGYADLSKDLLNTTLVDTHHRELLEGGKLRSKKHFEDVGIELATGVDIGKITIDTIYGVETHQRWHTLMKEPTNRRDILTENTVKSYYARLLGKTAAEYRTEEVGWGDNNYYPKLDAQQRKALDGHGLRYYPTIQHSEKSQFAAWLLKQQSPIKTTRGTKEEPEELAKGTYIQQIKANTDKYIAVNEDVLKKFRAFQGTLYNADTQDYVVSYGAVDEGLISHNLGFALAKIGTKLEQALAMYVALQIDTNVYIEQVQRAAASLQQEIAAIHPFDDGNGRLSRLMLYKVLQAYLPTSAQDLPVIKDPGQDLLMTKDDWYTTVFTT